LQVYEVSVTCKNNVSEIKVEYEQETLWPIVGLELTPPGAEKGISFEIAFSIEQGAGATFQVFFSANEADLTNPDNLIPVGVYNEETKTGISAVHPGEPVGLYKVRVVGHNAISDVDIIRNFTVESPIEGALGEMVGKGVITMGDTVEFTASLLTGSSITVKYEFGDEESDVFFIGTLEDWELKVPSLKVLIPSTFSY